MTESVGTRLRQAREKRQLGIDEVSDATKIRAHYLKALENDDLSAIPSAAQARGFLRLYAEFLGLQVTDLVPPPAAVPVPGPATAEPVTQPQGSAPDSAKQPAPSGARPGLLGNVRGFLRRRSVGLPQQPGSAAADAAQNSPPQTRTDIPDTGKKKLNA